MARNTDADGFKNKVIGYALTHFESGWRLLQSIPRVRSFFNRLLLRNAIVSTKVRPHQFSLMSDYTSWDSLTDRTFTGRHLPPATSTFMKSLPPIEEVTELFRRTEESYRLSEKSTVLFTSFAQWFTDGFLRTDREDFRKNTSNHEIDLCQIYGLIPEETAQLREFEGGRLKTSVINGEHFPPLYFDENLNPRTEFNKVEPLIPPMLPDQRKKHIFVGGVERLNVSVNYTMMSTLFLREHNRICGELAKAYPDWDDEQLFQTARNILIVILMRIVIEDYINHITPYHFQFRAEPWSFDKEKWYRTNWMTMEFNLLYRWHSMTPNSFLLDGQHLPLQDSLFNNELLVNRGLGPIFQDTSQQCAGEVGLKNTHPALLYTTEQKALELGRMARLRGYNEYRKLFSFPPVTDFNQITGNEQVQQDLKRLYKDVDNIELFVGLFAEDVRKHSALSPLIGRMVGVDAFSQALTNPLLSKNVFNSQTFSEVGWRMIQQSGTIDTLLHRNLGGDTNRYAINFTQDGDELKEPKVPMMEWPIGMGGPPSDAAAGAAAMAAPAGMAAGVGEGKYEFDERDLFRKKK